MNTDAIIVGSGIIGMTLALTLSKNNKKVVIIEKNLSNNLSASRTYAISEKTKIFFEDILIWKNIESINELNEMHLYYREYNNDSFINFKKKDHQKNIGYIVQSHSISKNLLENIQKDKNITIYDNCTVKTINNFTDGIELSTINDDLIKAKYLFSCEGSKSSIKKTLGFENRYDNYDSKAIVFDIKHEKSNKDTAIQLFLESGPVAFLPITPNKSSMVVSVKNKFIDKQHFNEKNICSYLEEITNNSFGNIELISNIILFDLIGFDSESYKNGNIIFVGDSAHSVHPLAGMGLNLGISDVIEINKNIEENVHQFGSTRFFSNYARKQKIINKKARQQLKLIEKIYSIENSATKIFVNIAMKNIQKSNFLKEKIINHANNNISFF